MSITSNRSLNAILSFSSTVLGLAVLFTPNDVWAACGEILVSKGDIKIESGAGGKISPGAQGSKVCQGDTVIAGAQSRAKVKMEDGNELNISPDSRIKLETYDYKPADNKKKVLLNVLYGKVRAATREENMYTDKSKDGQANTFQVKTKSAVAGVRGTDFLTSFDRQTNKTEVVTFKGNVAVGQPGPGGALLNPVSVGAGQKTEALPGAPPAPPKAVPAKEMEKMNLESKSDTGGTKQAGSGRDSGATSDSSDEKKDESKKEEPKKEEPKKEEPKKEEPKKEEPKREEPKKETPKKEASSSGSSDSSSSGSGPGGGTGAAPEGGPKGSKDNARSGGNGTAANSGPASAQGGSTSGAPGGTPNRSPSSAGGSSMITNGDLGKAPDMPNVGGIGGAPLLVLPPPPPPTPPPIPASELVRQQLETGPGKVNIQIVIPK